MRIDKIDEIRQWLDKAQRDIADKEAKAKPIRWLVPVGKGVLREVEYYEIKSCDDWKYQLQILFHWIGAFKDSAKSWLLSQRKDPNLAEAIINQNLDIALCYDLDIREKHGGEIERNKGKGRSGRGPVLGDVSVVHPAAVHKPEDIMNSPVIVFKLKQDGKIIPEETRLRSPLPSLVQVTAPVFDEAGQMIDDAFEVSKRARDAWDTFLRAHGYSPRQ